eukprot:GHVR01078216.1.p1 GENE.GHVR01078216.1~~GHVR01078216.1.p1  ORF type:complete len:103 (+),score=9.81 GHVR01078216.1:632-940(+)
MLLFWGKISDSASTINPFRSIISSPHDEFAHKDIKNYGSYFDNQYHVMPSYYNKLSEHTLWKMEQPGYLRDVSIKTTLGALSMFAPSKKREVAWDGTFNMPL